MALRPIAFDLPGDRGDRIGIPPGEHEIRAFLREASS